METTTLLWLFVIESAKFLLHFSNFPAWSVRIIIFHEYMT